MIKTYIDISEQNYIYYMVHDIITMRNGWDVITTVTKPDHIRIYFSYKWFQYGKVRAFKKAVKNYAKRVTYYDRTNISKCLFPQGTTYSSEKCKKELTRFSYATVLGDSKGRNVETTVNKEESK